MKRWRESLPRWDRQIGYVAVSDEAGIPAMRDAGTDDWLIEVLLSLSRVIAAGYAAGISADVAQLLGHAPIGFDRFVADHLGAWR